MNHIFILVDPPQRPLRMNEIPSALVHMPETAKLKPVFVLFAHANNRWIGNIMIYCCQMSNL